VNVTPRLVVVGSKQSHDAGNLCADPALCRMCNELTIAAMGPGPRPHCLGDVIFA
jgi:hypothetical protein